MSFICSKAIVYHAMIFLAYISKNNRLLATVCIVGCFFLLASCNEQPEEVIEPSTSSDLNISVVEPVKRDLDQIKQSGILRMITNYSSNSYFIHQGIDIGFEYELVRAFAEEQGLALEVVIIGSDESPYDILNRGDGDLIAANYAANKERRQYVDFTRPYNIVNQVVVFNESLISDSVKGWSWDYPISINRNSSYYSTLTSLADSIPGINIDLIQADIDTEALLFQVSNGRYQATIADDNIFEVSNTYMNDLVRGPVIAENDTISWAIRKNASDLKTAMNRFLFKHFRFGSEAGDIKRSAFLNVLRKKYFKEGDHLSEYYNPSEDGQNAGVISPYDDLVKEHAEKYDVDWVMMTSMMAQESRFNPNSESWAGAVGLMQVLPRFSEFSKDSLFIPEINVEEGAKILRSHLDHYAYMDSTNQWAFALATYNAGLGHLADARRLVVDQNKDPNQWEHVSEALLMLMQRRFYQKARYGRARGIETVRYVSEILNRYKTFQAILELANNSNGESRTPGVLGVKTF